MVEIESLIKGLFGEQLINSDNRLVSSSMPIKIRLNRNESAFEVDEKVKEDVLNRLKQVEWRNYPTPYYNGIEKLIADYSGVKKEQVVPGAGSANIITALLNYFAINKRQIVLAHPSFSLYEYHCKTYGISYDLWHLNDELEYDVNLLPELEPYSLVLFASPNNPVGNVINRDTLKKLLKRNPDTVFAVDEVYSEFCKMNLSELINEHANLILLRSFSKSFSSAGLRVGYLIANEFLATNIRKLILPFVLNYLSVSLVTSMLTNAEAIANNEVKILKTIEERERVFHELNKIIAAYGHFTVKNSMGNFLLVKFSNIHIFNKINAKLEEGGIKLLDLSNVPVLGYSFRMTIGKPEENNAVLKIFSENYA